MKTRIVHTKIWNDQWFQSLSRSSSLIFLYLITCPDITISGVFELPDRKIMFDTNTTSSEVEQAKKDLSEKIIFYEGWIYVKNVDKFNSYKGPKNETAREKELTYAPKKLIGYIRGIDTSIDTSIDTTHNTNHNTNHNQKSEIRKKKNNFGDNYINDFNELFGGSYKLTTGRQTKLQARLKTFTEEQILQALRGLSQSDFHKGKNDTGWKADPDFLIRNDEQVDKWLNAYQEKEKPKKIEYLMGDKSIFAKQAGG